MDLHEYLNVMATCGTEYRQLSPQDRLAAMRRWREVFSAPSPVKTGESTVRAWRVFGRPDTRAVVGCPALEAYRAEHAATFYVFPEDPVLPALECRSGQLPDFDVLQADVYVWPEDLSWTMAFTNNANVIETGPYFSRREWMQQGSLHMERPN